LTKREYLRFAARRLQADEPVKSIALDLGYRHGHDFSRFYRQQTGHRLSELTGHFSSLVSDDEMRRKTLSCGLLVSSILSNFFKFLLKLCG